jgi:hypothetical protein
MPWLESSALQGAYGFESSDYSHDAVVFPCIGDRIQMGTGADGRCSGTVTVIVTEEVARAPFWSRTVTVAV